MAEVSNVQPSGHMYLTELGSGVVLEKLCEKWVMIQRRLRTTDF